jgi:hypothetical protein
MKAGALGAGGAVIAPGAGGAGLTEAGDGDAGGGTAGDAGAAGAGTAAKGTAAGAGIGVGIAGVAGTIAGVADAGIGGGAIGTAALGAGGAATAGLAPAGVYGRCGVGRDGRGAATAPSDAGVTEIGSEPPAMAITPPHTEQRARTPVAGTFAGSTRKTDRQSGHETVTVPALRSGVRCDPAATPRWSG